MVRQKEFVLRRKEWAMRILSATAERGSTLSSPCRSSKGLIIFPARAGAVSDQTSRHARHPSVEPDPRPVGSPVS